MGWGRVWCMPERGKIQDVYLHPNRNAKDISRELNMDKGLMNKVNRIWVVGNGAMLNYKVYNKNYWNSVPGNLYIDVPQQVQDEQITVLAVLLDGPIKLYRGVGQVQDNN